MKSQKGNLVCFILGIIFWIFAIAMVVRFSTTNVAEIKTAEIRVLLDDMYSEFGEPILTPTWTVYGKLEKNDEVIVQPKVNVKGIAEVGKYEIYAEAKVISNSGVKYEVKIVPAKYTILPRGVKLIICDKESVYGDPNVGLSAKVENTIRGTFPNVKLFADIGKNVGEYPITGIVQNPNYKVVEVMCGTYTKKPREIEIYVDNKVGKDGKVKPEMTSRIVGKVLEGDDLGIEYTVTETKDRNIWAVSVLVKNENYKAKVYGGKYTVIEEKEKEEETRKPEGNKPGNKKPTSGKTQESKPATETKPEETSSTATKPAEETKPTNEAIQESKPSTETSASNNHWNSSDDDDDDDDSSSSGGNNRPAESKPSESKPSESKPTESKPTESKPSESKPSESKPSESKPSETEPSETNPPETDPPETDPPATDPSGPVAPGTPGESGDNVSGGDNTGGDNEDNGPATPGTPGEGGDNVTGGDSTGNGTDETPDPPSIPGDGGDNVTGGGSTGGGSDEAPAPPSIPDGGGDSVSSGSSTAGTDSVSGGVSTASATEVSMPNDSGDVVIDNSTQ